MWNTRKEGGAGRAVTRNKMDGENGTQNEELTNPITHMNVASPSQEQHTREKKNERIEAKIVIHMVQPKMAAITRA